MNTHKSNIIKKIRDTLTYGVVVVALSMFGWTGTLQAQTANVQIIHNAADPAADTVDIYVNGDLTLDNFGFRSATGFLELPAGDHTVSVAGQNSSSVDDAIADFDITLEADENYTVIANGVLDPEQFSDNPDDKSTGFNLWINTGARMSSTDSEQVQFNVVHGASDAPSVDVGARGVATLVEDAAYGDITDYLGVPAASYMLDIRLASLFSVVASFQADLGGLAGGTATVLASGFLNPSNNQDGEGFALIAVLADGTVITLPNETSNASVQVIHNAADPNADTVDVYINNELAIDDFGFRSATSYLSLPAGVKLAIGIAPGNSSSVDDTLTTFRPTLAEGETYGYIASGVLSPGNFANNPDGISTAFNFLLKTEARKQSMTSGDFQFYIVHGSTDAPAVDIVVRDVATLVEGATYTAITDYFSVAPNNYTIDIYPAGSEDVLVSFGADVSSLGDQSAAVLASGFLDPSQNNDGEAFGLLLVLADGTTVMLPETQVTSIDGERAGLPSEFRLLGNYPNPFNPSTQVVFDLASSADVTMTVYNLLGQRVQTIEAGRMSAGSAKSISFDASGLNSGNYLYRLQIANGNQSISKTGKMVLLK